MRAFWTNARLHIQKEDYEVILNYEEAQQLMYQLPKIVPRRGTLGYR